LEDVMGRPKQKTEVLDDSIVPGPSFLFKEREMFITGWREWVKGDSTAVVGTLEFGDEVTNAVAQQWFDDWIGELQKVNRRQLEWRGGPTALYVRANRCYFHVLIKGLEPANLRRAERTWKLDFGRAYLEQLGSQWTGPEPDEAWSEAESEAESEY
jgi:hypothetical protein